MGRDDSVGIATGYGLDARGLIPGRGKVFFSITSEQALEPTQRPVQWVPRALSAGVKRPEREADHSLSSSDKVKNVLTIPPLPHTPLWRGA
jgi:hypothetical protein